MERASLLRSSRRLLFRPRFGSCLSSSSPHQPRPQLTLHLRALSSYSAARLWQPVTSTPLRVRRSFSISPRAFDSSSSTISPEIDRSDDIIQKLGFEKLTEQTINECKATAVLYKHKKTGAEVMSVSNDDENKVFGIILRTPPKDSTGIPHILEHSVLCGSRNYPLKEPFVEPLKGSLHTFLNAFTYPDRTCYPVASTNTKEGWHYELENPVEDISFKGVVFNEMKGVYSQPDNILGRVSQQALFPENTYGVDSGGDPKVIPKLAFEEFKAE